MVATRNVVLTGFMGTGKTTVGRVLAAELDFEFVDTDELIEERHGPISDIFAQQGEEAFRALEGGVARELGEKSGMVIATGGRLMLDEQNVASLGPESLVFTLVASGPEIMDRVTEQAADRPLLAGDHPAQRVDDLLEERRGGYARFPRIATSQRTPSDIATEIAELVRTDTVTFLLSGEHTPRLFLGFGEMLSVSATARTERPVVLLTEPEAGDRFGPLVTGVDATVHLEAGSNGARVTSNSSGVRSARTVVAVGGSSVQAAAVRAARHVGDCRLISCPTTISALIDALGAPSPVSVVVADVACFQQSQDDAVRPGELAELREDLLAEIRATLEG